MEFSFRVNLVTLVLCAAALNVAFVLAGATSASALEQAAQPRQLSGRRSNKPFRWREVINCVCYLSFCRTYKNKQTLLKQPRRRSPYTASRWALRSATRAHRALPGAAARCPSIPPIDLVRCA